MIRLFLWACTLIGFLVVWIIGAYFTQRFWLIPLISNRIEPFGLHFQAQDLRWLPEWPLCFHAKQIVVSYQDGNEPKDLLRGPELKIILEAIPWSNGAWQIRRCTVILDELCWAPRRILNPDELPTDSLASTYQKSASATAKKAAAHSFSLLEYQFQLTRLIIYPSKPSLPPITYLLNLKTPLVRGPFEGWNELQKGVFPSPIKLDR